MEKPINMDTNYEMKVTVEDVANTFLNIKEILQGVLPMGKLKAVMDRQIFAHLSNLSDPELVLYYKDQSYSFNV